MWCIAELLFSFKKEGKGWGEFNEGGQKVQILVVRYMSTGRVGASMVTVANAAVWCI